MSIRTNALGYYTDLAPELQSLLRKNGMQAHIVSDGDGVRLAVQGHDSPLLTYSLSSQQLKALTDWGTTYANKHAYDTFAALVAEDFHLPKDFVHARNANGRVVMGLHGYRIGTGEYGRTEGPAIIPGMWGRYGILGWTPRMQEGFHMRRVGGAPMVADRPDGRMKPGELQNGGYGFYYKGQDRQMSQDAGQRQGYDVLSDLKDIVPQIQERPKQDIPAIAYRDRITSDVYFTKDSWKDVLDSHGLLMDEGSRTLTVQSSAINRDFVYDLSAEEVSTIMNESLRDVPLERRLDTLNGIIGQDYESAVTMEILNSKELLGIAVRPEVIAEITGQEKAAYMIQQDIITLEPQIAESLSPYIYAPMEDSRDVAHVDGQTAYDSGKGWFREGQYGREVTVQDIRVEPVRTEEDDRRQTGMKYRMTAVINGEAITHEITARQYDKFMSVDDYHRMKLFSQVFKEVDMKDLPQQREENHFGIGLLAALTVAGEIARGQMTHHASPDIYMERHAGGPVFMKPGVDSPQDIASRAFEAGINAAEHGVGLGR